MIANELYDFAYSDDGYNRPSEDILVSHGGYLIESSNWDVFGMMKSSGISFSPTEVWEFSDNSKLMVGYSRCEVI